jgi:hypothetical protein
MFSAERKGFSNEMNAKGGIREIRIPVALTAVSCLVQPVVNIQGVLGVLADTAIGCLSSWSSCLVWLGCQ